MIIDTNILIDFVSGDEQIIQVVRDWRERGVALFISTIVEAEFLSFSKMVGETRQLAIQFLEENFISVPFDRPIARLAADVRQTTNIKFPDAGIAATALFTHTPLVTRNVKDFRRVLGLQILSLEK